MDTTKNKEALLPKIGLTSLVDYLHSHSIEESYELFRHDYAAEINDGLEKTSLSRNRFVALFAWRSPPTSVIVRRLFNQVNTFYAERWLLEQTEAPLGSALFEANYLTLYRQGKNIGLRAKRIGFGYRLHLDFMDPFRSTKWLYGIGPSQLGVALDDWCRCVDECLPSVDAAIALTMAFIAIHPFSDANGRIARLVFTWMCKHWRLKLLWLNEAEDGEVLRTGHGIHSTEYLMAMFMIKLTNGHNVIDPSEVGNPSQESENKAFEAMSRFFADLRTSSPHILATAEFKNLKTHLQSELHFQPISPRFACLRGALL
jgi:Fic/DOC family